MSFDRLKTPPSQNDYISPNLGDGITSPLIPPIELLTRERKYWQGQSNSDNALSSALSSNLVPNFDDLINSYADKAAVAEHINTAGEREVLNLHRWHKAGAQVMAMSRLYRELPFGEHGGDIEVEGLSDDPFENIFSWDFVLVRGRPASAAIHFEPDQAEGLGFSAPPFPNKPTWYVGESIYLQVTSPARLSRQFKSGFLGDRAEAFRQSYISAMPRIMQSVWASGKPLSLPNTAPEGKPKRMELSPKIEREEVKSFFQLSKPERKRLNEVNDKLVNGHVDNQINVNLTGTDKEIAKTMMGVINWVITSLGTREADDIGQELSAKLFEESSEKLIDTMLFNRDQSPKWPHLAHVLKRYWPEGSDIDWDQVHHALLKAHNQIRGS